LNSKVVPPLIFIFPVVLLYASCSRDQPGHAGEETIATIEVVSDLVIGSEDQPLEYQLGDPIAVRTDDEGHIYIADRYSREIKIFDSDGNYLRSIGGRGRGPGEFQDIEFMERTPEGHLVLMDRGNLRYTVISTEGEEIASYPYNMSEQFYPQSFTYVDGQLLALFCNSSPKMDRDLFYIYSTDFQNREHSFMQVNSLGYRDMFPVSTMVWHAGSFTLSRDDNVLFFSPNSYTGSLFKYRKTNDGQWEFDGTLQGREPGVDPYHVYTSESQYDRASENGVARAAKIHSGYEIYMGGLFSMDAGLFSLEDDRLVHFYAEWKEGYESLPGSESHPMDLYVQIFSPEGELQHHGNLFSFVERFTFPVGSVVKWMDKKKNFYMLDHPDEIPVVRAVSFVSTPLATFASLATTSLRSSKPGCGTKVFGGSSATDVRKEVSARGRGATRSGFRSGCLSSPKRRSQNSSPHIGIATGTSAREAHSSRRSQDEWLGTFRHFFCGLASDHRSTSLPTTLSRMD
jgi:hypothetical protein